MKKIQSETQKKFSRLPLVKRLKNRRQKRLKNETMIGALKSSESRARQAGRMLDQRQKANGITGLFASIGKPAQRFTMARWTCWMRQTLIG